MDLAELGAPEFWRAVAGPERVRVTVVLPTGRALASLAPHLALSSDGLYLTELAMAVDTAARAAGLPGASIGTALDIDVYEDLQSQRYDDIADNLLAIGSADVNLVAAALLEKSRSHEVLRAGFRRPYEQPLIEGAEGKLYGFASNPYTGVLACYENPWSKARRFAALSAGLFAIGTVAATRLLVDYVKGQGDGNNRLNPQLPLKVINGVPRRYRRVELRPYADCLPPMDVVNITDVTVLE